MNKITTFLIGAYLLSAAMAWVFLSRNTATNENLARDLVGVKNELATTKSALATEQATHASLDKKLSDARMNANFLSLALCPALEATDKNALCVKNSTEWFSQTVQSGTLIINPDTKTKMDILLVSLSSKKRPTAKEFYEMLKPIELGSLKTLSENLK